MSLADDLLADVVVTALHRRHSYDPARGTARNWLFGIAPTSCAITTALLLAALDREILLLNSWAQLDPTEIAVAIGIPVGTVRSRLHRIRTTLGKTASTTVAGSDVIPYPHRQEGVEHG